jgi:hypothetical protein
MQKKEIGWKSSACTMKHQHNFFFVTTMKGVSNVRFPNACKIDRNFYLKDPDVSLEGI